LPEDSPLHPLVGRSSCFLEHGSHQILLFHGPLLALMLVNIIQFLIIVRAIFNTKQQTRAVRAASNRGNADMMDQLVRIPHI
jgi:hypothetical protein